jgi:hypothetical protein
MREPLDILMQIPGTRHQPPAPPCTASKAYVQHRQADRQRLAGSLAPRQAGVPGCQQLPSASCRPVAGGCAPSPAGVALPQPLTGTLDSRAAAPKHALLLSATCILSQLNRFLCKPDPRAPSARGDPHPVPRRGLQASLQRRRPAPCQHIDNLSCRHAHYGFACPILRNSPFLPRFFV